MNAAAVANVARVDQLLAQADEQGPALLQTIAETVALDVAAGEVLLSKLLTGLVRALGVEVDESDRVALEVQFGGAVGC